ncbi:universal stress protein [Arthrobacter sp. AET 35A]|uniref:universal stress protein n=1 Tax=Arthrobacter sp. AET 35A TaxID=2292643 RepID=UPI001780F88B|nr:universal stress protein [Arthrobacter sp. AET 35A]MBE0011303.1 universal stress protein [Arthrobacter sp. AET 35A]
MSIVLAHAHNPSADAAFDFALAEAVAHHCKLVIVNSSHGTATADPALASDEQLAALEARATAAGVAVEIERPMRGNDAETEVLEAAERHSAKMIVIGTRHRSTVGKFILGSTAQRIIMDADVPVVAVKPPKG